MRYAKGGLVINAERDIPLLRQVRNSRFVSHAQLFEFMKLAVLTAAETASTGASSGSLRAAAIVTLRRRVWRRIARLSDRRAGLAAARTSWPVHDGSCIPILRIFRMFLRFFIRFN